MNIDRVELDHTIGDLLDRYNEGTIERATAIDEIAHVIQAVAQGNESDFHSFIRSHKAANNR